jgi:hypothetical protein
MTWQETTIVTLASGIISSSITAFINYKFFIKQKVEELNKIKKIESYKSFFNDVRAFLNDPTMDYQETIAGQKNLLKKFYDEIYPFGSLEVIEKINKFFDEVSISYANEDEKTKALKDLVFTVRKDLGLPTNNDFKNNYKIFTPNVEKIKSEKR